MQKTILYGKEARQKIKDGIDKVANAVKVTLGPQGRNVVISRAFPSETGMRYTQPHVTKDGVTVARNIFLTDYLENTGALMIKEAAEKTMALAGDGTTTTCVLVQAIVEQGFKLIEQGKNPMELKREIDLAVEDVVAKLKQIAIPVGDGYDKIKQIATISANNDEYIGGLVAEAFEKIGKDGDVSIEESKTTKTEIKVVNGYQFNRGWISPYFITNNARNECELIDPLILLYDKKLYQLKPLENIINIITAQQKPILIICEDAEGEALAALTYNHVQNRIRCCIVKCPGFGDEKREMMEDIAAATGGFFVNEVKGVSLENLKANLLGTAQKVIIGKDETIIIGGGGKKEAIEDMVNELKMNRVKADDFEKEKIDKRIAKLMGGVAVIYVGAPTETEMKERKDRVDDAIRATKAAIAEGFVAGGGSAFFKVNSSNDVVDDAIHSIFWQICNNSGVDGFELLPNGDLAYNAKTGKMENLIESGVIDPVKVLRCSLEHAASTATMLLTSEAMICDIL